jgi:glycosyltransferase involved in cell wall biosynthesis
LRIIATGNTAYYLANFQSGVLRGLVSDGHRLIALVPKDEHMERLEGLGCDVVPLKISRRGTILHEEARLLGAFLLKFRSLRPDVILSYTIKNNIYGGLAARMLRIPFIPNVSGLGSTFASERFRTRLIPVLYRNAFRNLPIVFFQNTHDRELFSELEIVGHGRGRLLPGSGVDTTAFLPCPLPGDASRLTFLLVARLLWAKGIGEYAGAARQLASRFPGARFQIVGPYEDDPLEGVPRSTMEGWLRDGPVEYLGQVGDIREVMAQADCVVLPSYYREGTPRALLEAAAMGRPIVTTDWPGCRSVVDDGKSGFLCRPRDADDLAAKLTLVAEATPEARAAMGRAGRSRAEEYFDERLVVAAYRDALDDLFNSNAMKRLHFPAAG